MAESLQFVQDQLAYHFQDEARLQKCFQAAHRSDLDGSEDDGNRGLSQFGQSIMEAVELQSSLNVGREARYVASQRTQWVKSRDKRAEVCDAIDFSRFIVASVRQGNAPPSKNTRALVISAIIGAVFLDLWAQAQTVNVVWEQIAAILDRIGARANGNLPVNPADIVRDHYMETLHAASAHGSGSSETGSIPETNPEMVIETSTDFTSPPHRSPSVVMGTDIPGPGDASDTPSEVSYDLVSDPGLQEFPGQMDWDWEFAQRDHDPFGIDEIPVASESATSGNDMALQSVIEQSTENQDSFVGEPSSATSVAPEPPNGPRGRRPRVSEENEELRGELVQDELMRARSSGDTGYIVPFLDHQDIPLNVPASRVDEVRLLYFYIGSAHSVAAFRRALSDIRSRGRDGPVPHGGPMSTVAHLQMVERLNMHSAANSMLARWHILKAFEADLDQAAGTFVNQVQISFHASQPQGPGNARSRATTVTIDAKMGLLYPSLPLGSREYESQRRRLMRLFKIAKYLYTFTERFGFAVLAFLPYMDDSSIYLSDNMLVEVGIKHVQYCVDLLHLQQGPYLMELTARVRDVVDSLVDGSFRSLPLSTLERCSEETIMASTKGSVALIDCL